MPPKRKGQSKKPNEPKSEPPSKQQRANLANPTSTIGNLPSNILLKVINYLPISQWAILERVNKQFRDVLFEKWLSVKKIRLAEDFAGPKRYHQPSVANWVEAILEKLLIRAPNILDIGGFDPSCTDVGKQLELMARFEKLERLEIEKATDVELAKFLIESSSRDQLKYLVLGKGVEIERDLESIMESFENEENGVPLRLESLDWSVSIKDHLNYVSPILEGIDISRLVSISIADAATPRAIFLNFINRAVNLERLNCTISWKNENGAPSWILEHSAEDMAIILRENLPILEAMGNLEKLESLSLNAWIGTDKYCKHADFVQSMNGLLKKCGDRGNLNELSITGDLAISEIFAGVAIGLPRLESLKLCLRKCDDATLEGVLSVQKSLIKIHLIATDIWMSKNVKVIPNVLGCSSTLKSIRLECPGRKMTKDDLNMLVAFTKIEELTVKLCDDAIIDDDLLSKWAESLGPRLKSFEISSCHNITDAGLISFLSKTPELRRLSCSVSGKIIPKIERELPISDVALKEIPELCPKLSNLALNFCGKKITAAGVQVVIDKCSLLKYIRINSLYADSWFPKKLTVEKYRKIIFMNTNNRMDMQRF